ncbi:MAG: TIGR03619 family F420-dependent LLM class oxidoreductase [Kibdelosporangium sp.]
MKFGLFAFNINVGATDLADIAELAEESGWESVWTGEHYVLPEPPLPELPLRGDTPMLDPFVALAVAAARTERLLLGTGVTVVPMHQPLALAKRIASLDQISGGRFLFGIGLGYLAPEFAALGVPFDNRAARTAEYLDAMIAVWTGKSYHGRYFSFDGVRAEPRPVRGVPPMHFGGHVPAALHRAVNRGQGWYGWDLELAQARAHIGRLKDAGAPAGFEFSVTPSLRTEVTAETVGRFADIGVTRLILMPPRQPGALRQFVRELPGLAG